MKTKNYNSNGSHLTFKTILCCSFLFLIICSTNAQVANNEDAICKPEFNPCNNSNVLDFSENGYDWGFNDMSGSYTVGEQTFDINFNDPDGIFAAFQDVQVDPDDDGSYENNTGIAIGINPHDTNDALEINYNLSLVSDYVAFTIRDLDRKYYSGSKQIEKVCIFGYLDGVEVSPNVSSLCGSVEVNGNCAVGTTSSSISGKDESIRVVFESCINEIKIVYGNADNAADDPSYSRIFIGDDTGFGTAVCTDVCDPCTAEPSEIVITGGNEIICVDDSVEEPIDVQVNGGNGENSAWVITDSAGVILDLPTGPPFVLDDAGEGTCLIWYLNWDGDLAGTPMMGVNAGELVNSSECAQLSNPITIVREICCTAEASQIAMPNGNTERSICVDDDVEEPIDVEITGGSGENSAWVITDADGNILDLPAGPPFILDGAGEGTCLIWYLTWDGELSPMPEVSLNATEILDNSFCAKLSNFISVTRENCCTAEASTIELIGDNANICIDDDVAEPIDVELNGAAGENSSWIITDENANILALPSGPPFNFDDAGEGTCLIWHLNWDGELSDTLAIDANAADIVNNSVCAKLSNSIPVVRERCCTAEAAQISIVGSANEIDICVNDETLGPIEFSIDTAGNGANSAWVVTDSDGIILQVSTDESLSLDLYGTMEGTCLVWYLNWDGDLSATPEEGANASDIVGSSYCAKLSEPVTINRTCCCPYSIEFSLDQFECTGGFYFPEAAYIVDSNLILEDDSLVCNFDGSFTPCTGDVVIRNSEGTLIAGAILEPGSYRATGCDCAEDVVLEVTQDFLDGCTSDPVNAIIPSVCNGGLSAQAPAINSVFSNSATIQWNPQNGTSLQYKAVDSNTWVSVTQTNGYVVVPNLQSCKEYEVQLNYPCVNGMITSKRERFTTGGCVSCTDVNPQLTPMNVTKNSAILNWDIVSGSMYTLHYRTAGENAWQTYNTMTPFVVLFGLDECTEYEFGLKVTCTNARTSGMSDVVKLGDDCGGLKTGSLVINDNNLLSIYPNPATSFVDISLVNDADISTIEVYNVSGKLLFDVNNLNYDGLKYTASVIDLPKGLYFVTVTVEDKVYTKKFLKE